jgi:hypothetical protein
MFRNGITNLEGQTMEDGDDRMNYRLLASLPVVCWVVAVGADDSGRDLGKALRGT